MTRVSAWPIVVLVVLAAGPAMAQETTGDIVGTITSEDGQPLPGVIVTVVDPARGFERGTSCCPRGTYKLVALQPARYELTASLDGFKTAKRPVRVELGATVTADIQMEVGEFTDTIEVTGAAPQIDRTSTVSGLTANTDELNAQLPISRDVTRVAMLAPGTIDADPRFGRLSGGTEYTPGQVVPVIAGASVAENGYLVNGLNITNFRQMVGSTYVPMDFVEEVQVKTGGYQAEFGRSTGGVVNLVTKSGTNTLRGGVSVYWNPEGLQENEPDIYERDNEGTLHLLRARSSETRTWVEANASLGGALVKDRLFLFGFVRYNDWSRLDVRGPDLARTSEASDPYWGGKIDWNLTSSHRLEGTFVSDRTDVDETFHLVDPETGVVDDDGYATGYSRRGGESWVVKYSGLFGDSVLLSAQGGVNPFERTTRSDADDVCPVAVDYRGGYYERAGCWVNATSFTDSDERIAYRLDLDWFLGDHGLRAGVDAETNTTFTEGRYSGGVRYRYFLNGTEDEPSEDYRFPELPWDQELVRVNHYSDKGSFDVVSNAAYAQDSWAVTPSLTLNLGVRWERYETKNPLGESVMEVNDQYAPRLGAIWDVAGNGLSKLYGSYGVYHLPMSTDPFAYLVGRQYLDDAWYPLVGGIDPDGSPEGLGDQLDYILWADGEIPDPRAVLDSDFEPMSQSELIVGYEQIVGESWALGVRTVGRRFNEIIEDFILAEALYEVYGLEQCHAPGSAYECWTIVLTNPGSDFSGWYDLDGDGVLDPISMTAEQIGLPEAERTYLAVELTVRRRFADRWMLLGSYSWSHLYGNYDGLALSDVGQANPYLTQTFDLPGLMEHASGDLPNDRRHNLKLFGMYAFDFGLQLSGSAWYRSGRPVNAFGVHPTNPWAQEYGVYSFYNGGEPCPRGCAGTTEAAWALDLGVRYDWQWLGANWNIRVDAFNVTDNSSVEVVDEDAEQDNFQPNPNYLMPRAYQMPRSVRLGVGMSF